MRTRGLIILGIKVDNELAISLAVYFESVKKWKYVLRKKQNKTKRPKKDNLSSGSQSPNLRRARSKRYLLRNDN